MRTTFNKYWAAPLLIVGLTAGWQVQAAEIDFEGLQEGQIVDEVSTGAGVTGTVKGTIGVFGFRPAFGTGTNAAVVYDSDCLPGGTPSDCSGGDDDLGSPNVDFLGPGLDTDGNANTGGNAGSPFQNDTPQSNILIVQQSMSDKDNDGLVDVPDDADQQGQFLEFDFSALKGGGTVTVNSVTYMDNDETEFNAQIEMFGPKIPDQFIGLTAIGDNGLNSILGIGVDGVSLLRITLNGSGAVSNVVISEEVQRPCWVTLGGFENSGVTAGPKQCTFGGNVGPPPSGALEVNFHDGAYDGKRFHTNDIRAIDCIDSGSTGPQQPGGKKGLEVDTLLFDCDGLLNNVAGFTCEGSFLDAGEPQGKKGNDFDRIEVTIRDQGGAIAAECIGELAGGNIQIHPAVGPPL